MKKLLVSILALTFAVNFGTASAAELLAGPVQRKVVAFKLESVEIKGSTRLEKSSIEEALNLKPGIALDDEFVMSAREKLLSLGLFKSVILSMRKGSKRGLAILVVRLEDDPYVLGPWAIGGKVKIAQGEATTENFDPDSPPLGYKLELLSRNLFSSLYRGAIGVDIDSVGKVRQARFTLGLPRLAKEDVQFDFDVSAVDVSTRYLEVLGFAGKLYGTWTQSIGDYTGLEYGVAMYVNRAPDFSVPGFPRSLAGPRVNWVYESRLQRFFPDAGSRAGIGFIYTPIEKENSISEISLAHTFSFQDAAWLTMGLDTLALGANGYSTRGETRIDLPLTEMSSGEDQAGLYIALRGGKDKFKETNIEGTAAIIGILYHSEGFIAEISFQITRTPDALDPEEIRGLD